MEHITFKIEGSLQKLYGTDKKNMTKQIERYQELEEKFFKKFGYAEIHYFSTPGRIEISGNHTDHNNGKVLAASVDLDSIAVASKNIGNEIILFSEGYNGSFIVKLDELEPKKEEIGTTTALIRGIVSRFNELGAGVGGLNICMNSNVMLGSGLSSSASFEVLIGTILNTLYNQGKFSPEELAMIGQYSENEYFGKPCGLMDQMACAIGGIVYIDFQDPSNPIAKKVQFDFQKENYYLIVVDTGGNHADLTEDYAAIPSEMKSIARTFGKEVLRDILEEQIYTNLPELRKKHGDRAVLRSLHFLNENKRVYDQVTALMSGDFTKFLSIIKASGDSSYKLLQNIYTRKNLREQGISLALAITENYIHKVNAGACRVHGGGFAGTILSFLPEELIENYIREIEPVFGQNSVTVLQIRQYGSLYLNEIEY